MSDKTYNIGACSVFWTANTTSATEASLGNTSGGITINVSKETKEVEADQVAIPLDEIIIKATVTVTCPFMDISLDKLKMVFPGSTIVTDATTATKKKLVVSNMAGLSLADYGGMLRLHPVALESTDKSQDYLFTLAAPSGDDVELSYTKDDLTTCSIKFKAFTPTSGTYSGNPLIIGDPTATA